MLASDRHVPCPSIKLMDLRPWRSARDKHGLKLLLAYATATTVLLLILGARSASEPPSRERVFGAAAAQHSSGAVFVPYTQEHGFLRQTVQSLLAGGWRGRVIVIDNSPGHDTVEDEWMLSVGVEVITSYYSVLFFCAT